MTLLHKKMEHQSCKGLIYGVMYIFFGSLGKSLVALSFQVLRMCGLRAYGLHRQIATGIRPVEGPGVIIGTKYV